jgi:hypothetical protein
LMRQESSSHFTAVGLSVLWWIRCVVVSFKFHHIHGSGDIIGAKYGLAITNALMDAFGADLGMGYNIGCRFGTTIKNSHSAKCTMELNFKTLVRTFHDHAHNCLCQLKYLATHVFGLGLEDLEGNECFFSTSNGLSMVCQGLSSLPIHCYIPGPHGYL